MRMLEFFSCFLFCKIIVLEVRKYTTLLLNLCPLCIHLYYTLFFLFLPQIFFHPHPKSNKIGATTITANNRDVRFWLFNGFLTRTTIEAWELKCEWQARSYFFPFFVLFTGFAYIKRRRSLYIEVSEKKIWINLLNFRCGRISRWLDK